MDSSLYTTTILTFIPGLNLLNYRKGIHFNVPVFEKNWAFINIKNLYKCAQEKRWKINWWLFRNCLEKQFTLTKSIFFTGCIKENEHLYERLRNAGFLLEFRRVNKFRDEKIDGGNVNADLTSFDMDHKNEYDKAIIGADDGDNGKTIERLVRQDNLKFGLSFHSLQKT